MNDNICVEGSRPMWADLKAFCRFHGLPWPVGRIVGGPLSWHIRHPEKVALIRGRRKGPASP